MAHLYVHASALTNPRALAGGGEQTKYSWVLTQNVHLGLKPRLIWIVLSPRLKHGG